MSATVQSETDKQIDGAIALVGVPLLFALGFPLMLLRAYTGLLVWQWLVMPYTGWRAIPLPAFVGLMALYGVARLRPSSSADRAADKGKSTAKSLGEAIGACVFVAVGCLMTILGAWIWHLWFTR